MKAKKLYRWPWWLDILIAFIVAYGCAYIVGWAILYMIYG
jgi:hypothetical protein